MNLANRDYDEKRNFIRMIVDAPASIVLTEDQSELTGICRDLSGGGMQIELSKALPAGTEAIVSIASPAGDGHMMKARIQIARIISAPGDQCVAGMEILEILQ